MVWLLMTILKSVLMPKIKAFSLLTDCVRLRVCGGLKSCGKVPQILNLIVFR